MGTEPTRIKPPEGIGWQVHSPYGAQRYKDGPDGYVVRLADVVRWLMEAREMSFANAVRAVCAPLEGDAPPLLYRLDPTEDAVPQDRPSEWLKYLHGDDGIHLLPPLVAHAKLAARDMRAAWLMKPRELARLVNAPGARAVYDETKESPFEFSERTDRTGGPRDLTVPFAVAHELWGWGTADAAAAHQGAAPVVQLERADMKDLDTLCRYLEPYKGKDGSEWPSWEAEWVGYVRAAVNAHDAVNGRGGKAAVGRSLGMKSEAKAWPSYSSDILSRRRALSPQCGTKLHRRACAYLNCRVA